MDTLTRPLLLAPTALLSTPLHILSVPGIEGEQIQDITGECEDSIQFTAYEFPRKHEPVEKVAAGPTASPEPSSKRPKTVFSALK